MKILELEDALLGEKMFKFFKKKKVDSSQEELNELKSNIKSLLWNCAMQREKVESNLINLLPKLFPERNEEDLFEMRKSILKNINYGDRYGR